MNQGSIPFTRSKFAFSQYNQLFREIQRVSKHVTANVHC
jgi:hypothetical protein